ncbi:platelet glycoprotein 4-like isoform X3 [Sabethes cyaneus]|uniref:platelet glycoprotein 4-like isoform X3 n=1 Tax=Sabethes cyaneus TaxID=53552 RepID=UPI00237E3502|nr:platelet glycoprotein 4-like isoform X3 [Sabethes cyaneus]
MTIAEQKSCTNRQQQGQLCNNIYPNQQVQQTMQNNNPQQNTYAINSSKPLKKQTSALDNIAFHLGIKDSDSDQANDRNLYVTLSLLGVLFIVFIASVTGFFVMWFTDVYDNSLLEVVFDIFIVMITAEWWERPPVNPLLKVHVFNYTNVEEFIKGEATKLKVVDLGPYVYHETAEKVNVSYNGDGTITYKRNGTSAETFTIYSGETDLKQLAIIKGLDGKSSLDLWTTDECNRVDGTDGSQFPPHLMDKRQTLYVFIKSLCRKFPLQYEKEVTLFDGIPAWRYKAPLDVFAHPNINVDNQCFCHLGSASCPLSGLLNATLCSYGAPIYASFPHFYTGDEKLLETVDGLHPQREKHETYADIHPRLAFPIDGASRFQINVQVKKTSYITALEKFEDGDILPVVWLEVVPGVISEELRNMIYHSTFSANAIQLSFKYGSLLICVTTLALLTMACYCRTKNSPHVTYSCNEQPTQKKESDGTQRLNSSNEMKNHDI